ncbi:MAG: hypothetical protein ABW022_26965 [Actinoplanes sp.]
MLYGTPTHAAHRATADSGLALLVKSAGAIGQHRPPPLATGTHVRPRPQRRAPLEPQRTAQWLARGLAAVIVLGLAVMIGFLIVSDDGEPPAAAAELLGSRTDDPDPLTLPEVFPGAQRIEAAGSSYRVTMRHLDADCQTATTGALGQVLTEHGCSQVVRAVLTAPYGDYEVTAGVLNLADAAGAADVDSRLRQLVETGDGGFAALGGAPSAAATAQVGWHALGHYLLYCVITRPDGQLVSADDPYAARITADLVDNYLGESVLGQRASSSA